MTASHVTRRTLLWGSAGTSVLASSVLLAPSARAQRKEDAPVDVAELMKPDELPDLSVGAATAPCTVVEYASMTCPHCAHFAVTVWPELKKKFIETGKVRWVMREYPLDTLALGASMLTRCVDADKAIPMIEVLFAKQEDWAGVRTNAQLALFKIAQQAGFTQEAFDKCLKDPALSEKIVKTRDRANSQFGVDATPTFFINGRRMTDAPTLPNFEKAIGEIVKS